MSDNHYYNETLDFFLEKPNDWQFLPTAWAMNIRKYTADSNENLKDLLSQANEPFVYLQKPTPQNDRAVPTIQVSCRYCKMPDGEDRRAMQAHHLAVVAQQFTHFKCLKEDFAETICQYPVSYYRASFDILNKQGEAFACQSHLFNIFTEQVAFTLGMSGSPHHTQDYDQDFEFVLSSILIGQSNK